MKVLRVIERLASSSSRILLADFSAILSRLSNSGSLSLSLYRSARLSTRPVEHSCSASFSPIPSIPSFLHQYSMARSRRAGQSRLVQRMKAPTSISSVAQRGQSVGVVISTLFGRESAKEVPSA